MDFKKISRETWVWLIDICHGNFVYAGECFYKASNPPFAKHAFVHAFCEAYVYQEMPQ
jgi:hypothetical protein